LIVAVPAVAVGGLLPVDPEPVEPVVVPLPVPGSDVGP
jgi:hypothetical protein